jgi:IS5 family transposase
MLKENPVSSGQEDLFRSRLESIIDMRHELARLAGFVDWGGLEGDLSSRYCLTNGRPGEPIRLMAGLLMLKEMKGLSDEEVCAAWRENPYFQYFCGEEYFQHRLPVEPPSLSIFRKRIGEAGAERLLQETVRVGLRTGVLSPKDLECVTADTTVQEKAVRFPTDSHLCHKAREELAKAALRHGIPLRQSYARKGKAALFMANRYMAARQTNRGRKMLKALRNYLGRVTRDVERAVARSPELAPAFRDALAKARTIYAQAGDPKRAEKIYSWHAPETECVAKGKANKKYEFGCKASVVATNKSNFVVGAMALHGRPYDGHTLKAALAQAARLTGVAPREAHVDRGYRGHGVDEAETKVVIAGQRRGVGPALRKRQKRRNAVEPVIGHCKNDRKTGPKNFLKGTIGDKFNVIAAALGFNLRKILRRILSCLCILLRLFECETRYRPAEA